MNAFGKRLLKRSIAVAVVLAAIGYLFAEAFLMMQRMNGASDPANEAVRWRAPLNMAAIGVVLQVVVESLAFALRRKKPAAIADADHSPASTANQSGSHTV